MTEKAGEIQPIDRSSVHRICSGQVVLTLAGAVKELLENSIDAGSTNIEIRLKDYGKELIEVIDNGCGVKERDFESLTLKHHTSKIADFSDLPSVTTFGFRGEALSSLCALSNLSITTCHSDAVTGSRLEYDHDGTLIKITPIARESGTTVVIQNLFFTLPVRHKEFHRNLKKEYAKTVQLLTAYCLISINTRITCTNTTEKGRKSIVLSTNGFSTVKENILSVFGAKQVSTLMDFVQQTPSDVVLEEFCVKQVPEDQYFRIEGFISSCIHGEGRSTADRQFFYVNGRPCDLPKVSRIVNDMYHSFNKHQYPFIFLNIVLLKGAVDVNVTPDKRKIFIPEEKLLSATIKSSVLAMYERQPSILKFSSFLSKDIQKQDSAVNLLSESTSKENVTPRLSDEQNSDSFKNASESAPESSSEVNIVLERSCESKIDTSQEVGSISEGKLNTPNDNTNAQDDNGNEYITENKSSSNCDIPSTSKQDDFNLNNKQSSSSASEYINFTVTLPFQEDKLTDKVKTKDFDSTQSSLLSDILKYSQDVKKRGNYKKHSYPTIEKSLLGKKSLNPRSKKSSAVNDETVDIDSIIEQHKLFFEHFSQNSADVTHNFKTDIGSQLNLVTSSTSEANVANDGNCEEVNVIASAVDEPLVRKRKTVSLPFSLEAFDFEMKKKANSFTELQSCIYRKFRSKISPTDNKNAEDELRKEVSKDIFDQMEIIGQFNLGFIITKFNEDLFIIDQHASDEKYNFEILQRNTILETQKLLSPQVLELTAASETTLLDNIHIFETNGFKFNILEDSKPGQRVQLLSVPVSQNWNFGKEDVDELIFMLTDNSGQMCRPSRVSQMFASRACRKSVMIGTSLSHQVMKKLVCHMGEIEQPWNCPHGRPTMRHLFNMNLLNNF